MPLPVPLPKAKLPFDDDKDGTAPADTAAITEMLVCGCWRLECPGNGYTIEVSELELVGAQDRLAPGSLRRLSHLINAAVMAALSRGRKEYCYQEENHKTVIVKTHCENYSIWNRPTRTAPGQTLSMKKIDFTN